MAFGGALVTIHMRDRASTQEEFPVHVRVMDFIAKGSLPKSCLDLMPNQVVTLLSSNHLDGFSETKGIAHQECCDESRNVDHGEDSANPKEPSSANFPRGTLRISTKVSLLPLHPPTAPCQRPLQKESIPLLILQEWATPLHAFFLQRDPNL